MSRELSFIEALREGMDQMMQVDNTVFIIGEGVGIHGSCFKQTKGLYEHFGEARCRDTPISEIAITGAAVGAALTGYRPIADLMYIDFMMLAADQICNQAAKFRYISNGKLKVPIVIRGAIGALPASAAHHSGSFYSWFINIPGLKVVVPSSPYDAKGLIVSAILDDDPVIYLEHKMLFNEKGEVPADIYKIPIGKASIKREGRDITVVSTGVHVSQALKASTLLEPEGISIEVIDPRTLMPYDEETIISSVLKTGRLLVVDEGYRYCGFASEIISFVCEKAFYSLKCPPRQLTTMHTTMPFSPILSEFTLQNTQKIANEVISIMNKKDEIHGN
jgi:pyruvate dehydrogenase E1 component beta subunit